MPRKSPLSDRTSVFIISPGVAVLLGGFVFPVLLVLVLAFKAQIPGEAMFSNFSRFLSDPYFLNIVWRTLRLALLITLITAAVGFPLAYIIDKSPPWLKAIVLALTVLPLLTGVVVRTFSWMIVLGRGGLLSNALQVLGFSARDTVFLHSEAGIVIAMIQLLLPIMTLTILGVISGIDPFMEEASRTMGAGFYRTLRHVVLPLCLPGVVSGALLVFTLSMSSFITPSLIGGARYPVMSVSIYQAATKTLEWNFAAAQSALLLIAVLILLVPYMAMARRRKNG